MINTHVNSIADAKALRQEAEQRIYNILNDLMLETGLAIDHVDVEVTETFRIGHKREAVIARVEIDLRV